MLNIIFTTSKGSYVFFILELKKHSGIKFNGIQLLQWETKKEILYDVTLSQSFCSSIIAAGDNISGRILNA